MKIVFDRPWNGYYKERHWRMTEWNEKLINAINLWY